MTRRHCVWLDDYMNNPTTHAASLPTRTGSYVRHSLSMVPCVTLPAPAPAPAPVRRSFLSRLFG